jgi:hypothetical protein
MLRCALHDVLFILICITPAAARIVALGVSNARRTQAPFSSAARRTAMRSALQGPSPLITRLKSSQSGSVNSHWPVFVFAQVGVGQSQAYFPDFGHVHVQELLRHSSLEAIFTFQRIRISVCTLILSEGPKKVMMAGHQRFRAACIISR